jgi:hypothetical protein
MPSDCRRRCHSCDPNCATAVVSHDGKLRVALYTIKHVSYGGVLSYDYHCNTDDNAEYYNSKCLCGAQSCNTLYLSLTARHFDAIMESSHTVLQRFAMLARACESYAVRSNLPKHLEGVLASVGFGANIFRESPVWLKFFCAQVIEFIKLERRLLPQQLVTTDYSIEEANIEAEGVYGLRLQNLAITVDRVLAFLRRHADRAVPPLYPHTDHEVALRLVFAKNSIWSTLKEFVDSHERMFQKCRLKQTLKGIYEECGKGKQSLEAARNVLRKTAAALRNAASSYSPAALVLEVRSPPFPSPSPSPPPPRPFTHIEQDFANTRTFYHLAKYDSVKTDALQLSAEDVETGANVQLPASACLHVEEQQLPSHFVMEQLMFWYHQPQRKSDVLCFHGAGELPCPTNILRCCSSGVGASPEEVQRNIKLLAGALPPQPARRVRLHQFAPSLSEAVLGCAALGRAIDQLNAADVKDIALARHDVEQAKPQKTKPAAWLSADEIIDQRQEEGSKKKRPGMLYLVRWRNGGEDTWEPRCNLSQELYNQWINAPQPCPPRR